MAQAATLDLDALARKFGGSRAGPQPTDISLTIRAKPSVSAESSEKTIRSLAEQYGVDPNLALAVARKESSLNPKAIGDSGKAIGTFQLHAGAAEDTAVNRRDPAENLLGGVKYLKQLSDRYPGDTRKVLLAYNGGMGNVDQGTVSAQAEAYADEVMQAAGVSQSPVDLDALAQKLGGRVEVPPMDPTAHPEAVVVSNQPWDQFWRHLYAAIPDVTGMIGASAGGAVGLTAGIGAGAVTVPGVGAVPGGAIGATLGAEAGAGAGGIVGRRIQSGIDYLLDRPAALQNPRGVGEEATRQMAFEGLGRAFGGIVDRFRGRLAPQAADVAERLKTNKDFKLGLSTGTMSGSPRLKRVEYLASRGIAGYGIQKAAQANTDRAAQQAVASVLDTIGPLGTATAAGDVVQAAVQEAATRGGRRLEGSVATNLAPRTGMGTTGEMTEKGVQAGRTAFARQSDAYSKMVNEAPPVDMTDLHAEAWRIFRDDIMPKLIENPTLGPKTAEWAKVVRMYRQGSVSGSKFELSPATVKALGDAALEKAPYGPLRVINQILATPTQMSFSGALALRGTLRDAGKGEALLAGDAAEALATYFETGSRTATFKGIRGLLGETHEPYIAAAEAYRTSRNLFQSTLVEKVAASNPESVLASLTNAEGRFNASRIRQLGQVLQGLPKTYGTPEEIKAGQDAWNTVRAEWFRRDVLQDNVFGLADRMKKIDPDVLQAWFPDQAGKNVLAQATVTANVFESHLLAQLAEADPSKIVDMIGGSAQRVTEFQARMARLPGPVQRGPIIDRVRRAWTEQTLAAGDPSKLSDRIAKTDPDLLKAWFQTPEQQEALAGLRRIGNALSPRRPVEGMGAYEALSVVTIGQALLRGNLSQALTTALGFEGIPAFVSWAMYNPSIQKYLFEAAAPSASVTSKTAALLRALGAYRAASQQSQQSTQDAPIAP